MAEKNFTAEKVAEKRLANFHFRAKVRPNVRKSQLTSRIRFGGYRDRNYAMVAVCCPGNSTSRKFSP